jgi:hypothetical protein
LHHRYATIPHHLSVIHLHDSKTKKEKKQKKNNKRQKKIYIQVHEFYMKLSSVVTVKLRGSVTLSRFLGAIELFSELRTADSLAAMSAIPLNTDTAFGYSIDADTMSW